MSSTKFRLCIRKSVVNSFSTACRPSEASSVGQSHAGCQHLSTLQGTSLFFCLRTVSETSLYAKGLVQSRGKTDDAEEEGVSCGSKVLSRQAGMGCRVHPGEAALDGNWYKLSFGKSRKERMWVRLQSGEGFPLLWDYVDILLRLILFSQ